MFKPLLPQIVSSLGRREGIQTTTSSFFNKGDLESSTRGVLIYYLEHTKLKVTQF